MRFVLFNYLQIGESKMKTFEEYVSEAIPHNIQDKYFRDAMFTTDTLISKSLDSTAGRPLHVKAGELAIAIDNERKRLTKLFKDDAEYQKLALDAFNTCIINNASMFAKVMK